MHSSVNTQGHIDDKIAARVKVNPRTVGWFRRLAGMSAVCQELAYAHPELFNSRWAQQVARHGELPTGDRLEQHMCQMIAQKRTWHTIHEATKERAGASGVDKSDAVVAAHWVVTNLQPEHLLIRT